MTLMIFEGFDKKNIFVGCKGDALSAYPNAITEFSSGYCFVTISAANIYRELSALAEWVTSEDGECLFEIG